MAAGVLFTPFGNHIQQKVRKKISGETVLFIRRLLTLPFVFLLSLAFGKKFSWPAARNAFWFLLIDGEAPLGITKILWLEGIHRISFTKAVPLESLSPRSPCCWLSYCCGRPPKVWQLAAFVPLSLGPVFLTSAAKDSGLPPLEPTAGA